MMHTNGVRQLRSATAKSEIRNPNTLFGRRAHTVDRTTQKRPGVDLWWISYISISLNSVNSLCERIIRSIRFSIASCRLWIVSIVYTTIDHAKYAATSIGLWREPPSIWWWWSGEFEKTKWIFPPILPFFVNELCCFFFVRDWYLQNIIIDASQHVAAWTESHMRRAQTAYTNTMRALALQRARYG